MFVLDTDHLSLHQHGHPLIAARIQHTPNSLLAASIVSYEEQLRGWFTVIRRVEHTPKIALAYQSLHEMHEYFCRLHLLDFTAQAHVIYEGLRRQFRRHGAMDLRIAATVLAVDGVLVTRNSRDFSEISNLKIEDWTLV